MLQRIEVQVEVVTRYEFEVEVEMPYEGPATLAEQDRVDNAAMQAFLALEDPSNFEVGRNVTIEDWTFADPQPCLSQ